ncbi:MAG TPA: sulfatase-like hydrolase/transferase [Kofleriaceae bacterium]|nr:sulfatase-like hydrolase/transferase [Kofleriaceae bacterium]
MRAALRWLGRAALHAGIAGALLGLIEGGRIAVAAGGASALGLLLLEAGLGALGGAVLGVPLLGLAWLAARPRWVREWLDHLSSPGARRLEAISRALVAALAGAVLAIVAYRLAVWTHVRFRAPGAVGLLHAAALTATATLLWFAAATAAPPLGELLASRRSLVAATQGRRGAALLAVLLIGVVAAATAAWRAAAPAADLRPAATAVGFLALLVAVARLDLAKRLDVLGRAARPAAAALLVAVSFGSLASVSHLVAARQQMVARGVAGHALLRALWAASDRDGDGFAARFGGADCDDDDPAVHPGAREVADNGIDDNCVGGDLSGEMLQFRSRPVPSSQPDAPRHNVILISLDAVRADHTSAYGYERRTTPSLERLARRGTRFEWAITPSPTTRRAVPGMLTGQYASTMTFKESEKVWPPRLVRGKHSLLGQSFKRAGYDTAAILCCTTMFDRTAGIVEGIDHVDGSAHRIKPHSGGAVIDRVLAWLERRAGADRPFFLWIHLIDPHNPYQQPDSVPEFGRREIDRYDAEIRFVDDQIGRVLDALEEHTLAGRTIVAVTADHGDEFLEHGNRFHARSVYTELVRVPLIIAAPGGRSRVVSRPVSMIDLGPTLLDLVGLERPAGQNGRSLAGVILDGAAPPDRMVLAELIADRNITRNLVAGFAGTWHVIWDLDANTYELYDLAADPGNQRDLARDEPERLARMREQLARQIDLELTPLPERGSSARPRR